MDSSALEYENENYLRRNVHITFKLLKVSRVKQDKNSKENGNFLLSFIENNNTSTASPSTRNKNVTNYGDVEAGNYRKGFEGKLENYEKANDRIVLKAAKNLNSRSFEHEFILIDGQITDRGLASVWNKSSIEQELIREENQKRQNYDDNFSTEEESEGEEDYEIGRAHV
mgnify:CR=1 FL=1